MSRWFEKSFQVDDTDVDLFGLCRPSALMGYLQTTAITSAEELGTGWAFLRERYHAFWMLARMWYGLSEPIRRLDRITVHTWHRGDRGAVMYRDYDIFRDGVRIGEGVSAWVLAEVESRRLLRVSTIKELEGTHGGDRRKTLTLRKLLVPEQAEGEEDRLLRYSEADVNGHINNTRYVDYACDALHLEKLGAGKFPSELQIGYLAESRPGERLRMRTAFQDGRWYVHGLDGEGRAHFDAAVTLRPLDG